MDWKKKDFWIILTLFAIVLVYNYTLRHENVEGDGKTELAGMPLQVGDWQGKEFTFGAGVLDELKADNVFFRRYLNSDGEEVWLFFGYWKNQKYGAQPHSPLHCLPGSGWNIQKKELVNLSVSGNGMAADELERVNYVIIGNGDKQEAMLYWYQSRGGVLSKELSLKFDLAKNALFRQPTDAAFIRLTTPLDNSDKQKTLQILRGFWGAMREHVHSSLPFYQNAEGVLKVQHSDMN